MFNFISHLDELFPPADTYWKVKIGIYKSESCFRNKVIEILNKIYGNIRVVKGYNNIYSNGSTTLFVPPRNNLRIYEIDLNNKYMIKTEGAFQDLDFKGYNAYIVETLFSDNLSVIDPVLCINKKSPLLTNKKFK